LQLDLTREPDFAPPTETELGPLIPDPTDTVTASEEPGPDDFAVTGEQLPTEEAPPLTEDEPLAAAEATSPEAPEEGANGPEEEEIGDLAAGEAEEEIDLEELAANEEPEEPEETAELTGDDMFDEEPVFGRRSFTRVPPVNLPLGEASTLPGQSGVVAIFCPEEFTDAEKAAECAGRPEIRSGWRPGASGENWEEATRLLKQDRARGYIGDRSAERFGPDIARQLGQARRDEELTDFRRSADDINNQGVDGLNDPAAATRPNIGPAPFEPNWTLREDPTVSQKDIDALGRELEEADAAKRGEDPEE
jgi:hypothetical protein